ncbi:MAG: radical SAM protein [Candidatus Omnitrophota bacterium]|nr:radical SAM protein [Candidatus Omnitrophota bacterium]
MIKLFMLAKRRLFSSLGYKLSRGLKKPVKPLFINFIVTYMCNSKCIMCDIWQKYDKDSDRFKKNIADELTLNDITGFVKRNKEFLSDIKSIGFTGGEAFLRKDIVEIIKVVHSQLPWVDMGVQTNGLLPDIIRAKMREILSFYPNFKIAVSLDGIGDVHNEVRGIKDAYTKALTTIQYAKELGISGITCGMTLTPVNFNKIREVAKQVEAMGCEFSCFMAENCEYFGNPDRKKQFTQEQLKVITEELRDFQYHYFMDNLRRQITGESKRALPCYSGYTSYVIDPYGEVHPCILRNEAFGNIKGKAFRDMVINRQAWELRKKLNSCKCWCECEVSSSAIVAPWDVARWILKSRDKMTILRNLNKKTLLNRL